MESIRLILAYASSKHIKFYQMDVKYAFLNGFLKEEVYLKQTPGYEIDGQEGKVYRLKKELYMD